MNKTKKPGKREREPGFFFIAFPEKNNACKYYTTYLITVYSFSETMV